MSLRYDTTPDDDDRAFAREVLGRAGADHAARAYAVVELLGWRIEVLRHVDDPDDARIVARGRALYDLYREGDSP